MLDAASLSVPGTESGANPTLRGGGGYGALQRIINNTGEVPKEA